ncbi:MAG: N-acetyltransferase [Proteobacteria bacterium]|nr:N-acetyltransferase [Pseudomonadota bacterium]
MSNYIIFRRRPQDPNPETLSAPANLSLQIWRPTLTEPFPRGMPGWQTAVIWLIFQKTGVFASRSYAIVLIRQGAKIVHRSYIFPAFFRFPFMADTDVQVGDTWTAPLWRGHGLARLALQQASNQAANEGRTIWYVSDELNASSTRVARSCGFQLYARGERTARWGLRFFGAYVTTVFSTES